MGNPNKAREREMKLRGKENNIKFIDYTFERGQRVIRVRKGRGQEVP